MHAATVEVAEALTQLVRGLQSAGHAVARRGAGTWDKSMFAILRRLTDAGPQRLSALAEAVHLDLSTVSRQIAQLVAEGLVQRRPDPADGRASQLLATPAGAQLLAEKDLERRTWIARMLADWSPAEQAEFAAYLRRFNTAYDAFLPELITELSERHGTAAEPGADSADRTDTYERATT